MRQFHSVNLIHLLLQTKAKPELGDSKQDRLQRLNRQPPYCMTKLHGKPNIIHQRFLESRVMCREQPLPHESRRN